MYNFRVNNYWSGKLKKVLILTVAAIGLLGAKSTLAKKIAKLQTVPKSQRYKLVNEIKKELASLNRKQRIKAIRKLEFALDARSAQKVKHSHKNTTYTSKAASKGIKTPSMPQKPNTPIPTAPNTPTMPTMPSSPTVPANPTIPTPPDIPTPPAPNIPTPQNINNIPTPPKVPIPPQVPKPPMPQVPKPPVPNMPFFKK